MVGPAMVAILASTISALSSYLQHWWRWRAVRPIFYRFWIMVSASLIIVEALARRRLTGSNRTVVRTVSVAATSAIALLLSRRQRRPRLPYRDVFLSPASVPVHRESGVQGPGTIQAMPDTTARSTNVRTFVGDPEVSDDVTVRKFITSFLFRERYGREFYDALMRQERPYELQHYHRDEVITTAGDGCRGIWFVFTGTVGAYQETSPRVCLAELTSGGSFGAVESVSISETFPLSYIAIRDCSVVFISKETLLEIWSTDVLAHLSYVKGVLSYQWRLSTFLLNDFFHIVLEHVDVNSNMLETDVIKRQELKLREERVPVRQLAMRPSATQVGNLSLLNSSTHSLKLPPSTEVSPESLRSVPSSPLRSTPFLPPSTTQLPRFPSVPMPNLPAPDGGSIPTSPSIMSPPLSILGMIRPLLDEIPLGAGEKLYAEGSVADQMFIVLSGRVKVSSGSWSRQCTAGDILGSVAFLSKSPHQDSVVGESLSHEMCIVLCIDESRLKRLCQDYPIVVNSILFCAAKQLSIKIATVTAMGLQRVFKNAGQKLFDVNDPVRHLYVVVRGRVRMAHSATNHHRSLFWKLKDVHNPTMSIPKDGFETFDIGRSGTVGEISMFAAQQIHSASAICVRDSELVKVSANCFNVVCDKYPEAMMALSRSVTKRLYLEAMQPSSTAFSGLENLCTVCLMPLPSTNHGDLTTFAENLKTALENVGQAAHLSLETISTVDAASVFSSPAHRSIAGGSPRGAGKRLATLADHVELSRYACLVDEYQEKHRYVILQTDYFMSPWARLCVRNADCVILVGSRDAPDPSVKEMEAELIWGSNIKRERRSWTLSDVMGPHTELVIVHRQTSTHPLPRNTSAWIKARPRLFRHHHIRRDIPGDHARLVRHLTGRSIGLVLGGGRGSRTLAHLGELQAFSDLDLPVDYIGGTNLGALIGALYASTLDISVCKAHLRYFCEQAGSLWNTMRDMTVPVIASFEGRILSNLIRQMLGRDTQIEDLWLGYYCVSTNLSKVDVELCQRGSLWEAVRASCTIVGLMPPLYSPDGLLVDGAYANNLPADYMRLFVGDGLVIACDIEGEDSSSFASVTPYKNGSVSGFHLLAGAIAASIVRIPCQLFRIPNPFIRIMPSHSKLQNQLFYLTHQVQLRKLVARSIDLYIHTTPPVFDVIDDRRFDQCVASGHSNTRDILNTWYQQALVSMREATLEHKMQQAYDEAQPIAAKVNLRRSGVSMLSLIAYESAMEHMGCNPSELAYGRSAGTTESQSILKALLLFRNRQLVQDTMSRIGSSVDLASN